MQSMKSRVLRTSTFQLNGTRVYGWYWKGISGGPSNLVRRQRDKFEREQKDDAGRTVLERVPKPTQDSVGVLSDVNIQLYGYSAPEGSGFGFADSWTDSGKTEYAYYIPSKYLYEVNLTSLVVAPVSGQVVVTAPLMSIRGKSSRRGSSARCLSVSHPIRSL